MSIREQCRGLLTWHKNLTGGKIWSHPTQPRAPPPLSPNPTQPRAPPPSSPPAAVDLSPPAAQLRLTSDEVLKNGRVQAPPAAADGQAFCKAGRRGRPPVPGDRPSAGPPDPATAAVISLLLARIGPGDGGRPGSAGSDPTASAPSHDRRGATRSTPSTSADFPHDLAVTFPSSCLAVADHLPNALLLLLVGLAVSEGNQEEEALWPTSWRHSGGCVELGKFLAHLCRKFARCFPTHDLVETRLGVRVCCCYLPELLPAATFPCSCRRPPPQFKSYWKRRCGV
ncbi:uncharacterized protein [Lolium perenne]|uniref:uncharacterized protein n=1 Tax=Lolium perenne TaxID=4522 RepID=UPI0021F56DD9|nr:uncharacterized protein LOC127321542 [Lolium perenne]